MNNNEALAYIDRLWLKYGGLYANEKTAGNSEEAALMQKYFEALGVAKEAIKKIDKITGAMEEIAKERDKSYEGEVFGHGWGMQSALEILERAME